MDNHEVVVKEFWPVFIEDSGCMTCSDHYISCFMKATHMTFKNHMRRLTRNISETITLSRFTSFIALIYESLATL